jgi:hypothetical protein
MTSWEGHTRTILEQGGWVRPSRVNQKDLGAEQKRFHGATQNLYIVTVSRYKSKQEKMIIALSLETFHVTALGRITTMCS